MSELIVGRRMSFLLGAACSGLGAYCIQRAMLPGGLDIPELYVVSLLLFGGMALAIFQGVRFTGLDLMPKRWVAAIFWVAITSLVVLYFAEPWSHSSREQSAHFVVGIFLLVYSGFSLLGSYFSGFGAHLFFRNPISWVRDWLGRH